MSSRVCFFHSLLFLVCLSLGCGDSNVPEGPEKGSVQAYLDANPDVAARANEGDGDDGSDEVEGDGDSFDDE